MKKGSRGIHKETLNNLLILTGLGMRHYQLYDRFDFAVRRQRYSEAGWTPNY